MQEVYKLIEKEKYTQLCVFLPNILSLTLSIVPDRVDAEVFV